MDLDVVAIGNAIVDGFLFIHDANVHVHMDETQKELCVKAGEKILLDSCEFQLGGGACNVGVGLSRLGYKVAVVAEVGNDEFMHKITNTLHNENINTSYLKHVKKQSSFTLGLNFKNERTLFTNQSKGAHDFDFGFKTGFVYLAALGNEWKQAYEKAMSYVHRTHAVLAFNPGPLQLEGGVTGIKDVLAVTDILFLNKQEAEVLVGNHSTEELLHKLKELGPKMVVVTDGENGSFVLDSHGVHSFGIIKAEVVEKTGAGDGYAAGFLAAIMANKETEEAMRWGSINSSAVVGKIGAQAGLLNREKIEEKLSSV